MSVTKTHFLLVALGLCIFTSCFFVVSQMTKKFQEVNVNSKGTMYVVFSKASFSTLTESNLWILLIVKWCGRGHQHFNSNVFKFCFLYMVVQGRPPVSGFYKKMPKGIHLHLSTGLPGTAQVGSVWLMHGGCLPTPVTSPCPATLNWHLCSSPSLQRLRKPCFQK